MSRITTSKNYNKLFENLTDEGKIIAIEWYENNFGIVISYEMGQRLLCLQDYINELESADTDFKTFKYNMYISMIASGSFHRFSDSEILKKEIQIENDETLAAALNLFEQEELINEDEILQHELSSYSILNKGTNLNNIVMDEKMKVKVTDFIVKILHHHKNDEKKAKDDFMFQFNFNKEKTDYCFEWFKKEYNLEEQSESVINNNSVNSNSINNLFNHIEKVNNRISHIKNILSKGGKFKYPSEQEIEKLNFKKYFNRDELIKDRNKAIKIEKKIRLKKNKKKISNDIKNLYMSDPNIPIGFFGENNNINLGNNEVNNVNVSMPNNDNNDIIRKINNDKHGNFMLKMLSVENDDNEWK
jgi:hypothetical protein